MQFEIKRGDTVKLLMCSDGIYLKTGSSVTGFGPSTFDYTSFETATPVEVTPQAIITYTAEHGRKIDFSDTVVIVGRDGSFYEKPV